jgi:hypothetical protein
MTTRYFHSVFGLELALHLEQKVDIGVDLRPAFLCLFPLLLAL